MKTYAAVAGLTVVFIATITLSYTVFAPINQPPISARATTKAIRNNDSNKPVLGTATNGTDEIVAKINYWKKVIADHPDYRDGYMQLASLTYQMGNRAASIDYVEKVLQFDPNYLPAKELRNSISLEN